jgi:hypothetical protein
MYGSIHVKCLCIKCVHFDSSLNLELLEMLILELYDMLSLEL